MKRQREDEDTREAKRFRFYDADRLSRLSDELILRTLSYLPISTLTLCERLSQRFQILAGDPQLWKSAYYNRFVRPRALRIPGVRHREPTSFLLYSSRRSKWLEEKHLVKRGKDMDWKKQYKLRHNWSKGSCDINEIQIAERPSLPPMLVRLHEDIVITAELAHGLRAWHMKGQRHMLAVLPLDEVAVSKHDQSRAPTSLSINVSRDEPELLRLSIGFADGRFGVYLLDKQKKCLACQYMHAASTNGMLSAIAFASPYLITMTEAQLVSLYCFVDSAKDGVDSIKDPPRLLSSLKSHTAWPPLSLSIRVPSSGLVISIVYALPTYLSGWSVGLQELRLASEGSVISSRLTSATTQGFTPLSSTSSTPSSALEPSSPRVIAVDGRSIPSLTKPTSLSYSHPYLLASHPDNTLTLYLVTSTERELTISNGSRLWGHTSSVSGASVGDRGKAVSVSAYGDEIRVWELEGGFKSSSSKRCTGTAEASVQVRPDRRRLHRPGGEPSSYDTNRLVVRDLLEIDPNSLSNTKGWVGFDEESIIVLREKDKGSQALVVHSFA